MSEKQPGTIHFFQENVEFKLKHPILTRRWLRAVCEEEAKTLAEINYIFCSDDYLLQLNQQFLKHDFYTDILSFPFSIHPMEGDIFISLDRVKENASTLKIPFETELRRVMVHGLLHFAGYDDHEDEQKTRMRYREDYHLKKFPGK